MKNLFSRYSFAILTLGLLAFTASAQSRQVQVKNYNSISVSSGMDLYLKQGSSESIVIQADREISDNIVVEQKGSSLSIRFRNGFSWKNLFNNKPIKIYATYKNLNVVSASGGSDVYSQNAIKTNSLSLKASGGSDLKLSLACEELIVQVSGGSDAELNGRATNMALDASGGSDIDAFNLASDYARIRATGGSDVNAQVNKALEAGASGGGDVTFKGNATLKKTSSSKSGDVRRAK
ncbi:head GIN domain-containing protein [Pedobacter sp. SYP-B3415]|uniref:head GIN domain-containing protein n=1 Tax=Pedobacter sp. SYP-B3415 TaxID=2496641 RepID=UPI00101D8C6B|nr:head GIN domain-containing protein [Pedobacter sp. SYP-B3415]